VCSRFTGDDANRALEIHFRFDGHDLGGVGGIENVQLGKPFALSKCHAQDFRAKAGAAHAEKQRVLETRLLHVGGNLLQGIDVG